MWQQTTPGIPVTTADLLAAFLLIPDSLAARILQHHGVTRESIDHLSIQLASDNPEP